MTVTQTEWTIQRGSHHRTDTEIAQIDQRKKLGNRRDQTVYRLSLIHISTAPTSYAICAKIQSYCKTCREDQNCAAEKIPTCVRFPLPSGNNRKNQNTPVKNTPKAPSKPTAWTHFQSRWNILVSTTHRYGWPTRLYSLSRISTAATLSLIHL